MVIKSSLVLRLAASVVAGEKAAVGDTIASDIHRLGQPDIAGMARLMDQNVSRSGSGLSLLLEST